MKQIEIVFLFLWVNLPSLAQNLVPNWSFETQSSCPLLQSELYKAIPWFNPSVAPSTPDLYDSCSLAMFPIYQQPNTGHAYSGIYGWVNGFNHIREYIEVELIDSLKNGNTYCVSFFTSLWDNSGYAISNIGMYFSDTAINNSPITYLPFTPQFENPNNIYLSSYSNWMQINGSYLAHGGEKYIIIGNFRDDSNTNSLYIDTTQQQYSFAYYYIDDVSVIDCDSLQGINEPNNFNLSIYPNPVTNTIQISFDKPLTQNTPLQIFDLTGRMVYSKEINRNEKHVMIDVTMLGQGTYFVKANASVRKIVKM